MNYIGLSAYDTANGPGVRVSLFVSGCTLRCKGCFNKESWSFTAGRPFTAETEAQIMKALDSKWISGFGRAPRAHQGTVPRENRLGVDRKDL